MGFGDCLHYEKKTKKHLPGTRASYSRFSRKRGSKVDPRYLQRLQIVSLLATDGTRDERPLVINWTLHRQTRHAGTGDWVAEHPASPTPSPCGEAGLALFHCLVTTQNQFHLRQGFAPRRHSYELRSCQRWGIKAMIMSKIRKCSSSNDTNKGTTPQQLFADGWLFRENCIFILLPRLENKGHKPYSTQAKCLNYLE